MRKRACFALQFFSVHPLYGSMDEGYARLDITCPYSINCNSGDLISDRCLFLYSSDRPL